MIECLIPTQPGVYTLILKINKASTIQVGGLGVQSFLKGLYIYTGSALGFRSINLRNRISRHLGQRKKNFWHIDYLLASNQTRVKTVIYGITSEDLECRVAQQIATSRGCTIPIKGFGSSDCHNRCPSHLSFFAKTCYKELVVNIESIYAGIVSLKNSTTLLVSQGEFAN